MSDHVRVQFADPSNARYYYADRASAQGYQRGAYKTKSHMDKSYARCEHCQCSLDCVDAPISGPCIRYVHSLSGSLSGVAYAQGAVTGRAR